MASEASPAGDTHQRIGRANVDLEQELAEAHRRESATAEVLKVLSRSTFDLQDVLDSLVKSAVQLTGAETGLITRQDGEVYRAAAIYDPYPEFIEAIKQNPIPKDRQSATGRAVLDRRIVHIHDVFDDPEYTWVGMQTAGVRTILAVPMLRDDIVVGVIVCARREVRPFEAKQIELVQTFADQAVIAIENARLFDEVETRTRELTQALEYQTATSEVLGVISRSPTDAQPVFESIAQSAAQLCGAQHCNVYRFDGRLIHFAATHLVPGMPPQARAANMKQPPIAPGRGNAAARSIACGTVAEIPDIDADPDYERRDVTSISNLRSTMGVPMLKDGHPIGAIVVSRSEKGRFSERQIKLLQTFADQAVIAIENTRLFEEVQARTRELTGALDQQTSLAKVLSVISASPGEVRPVFDAILEEATRLCEAQFGVLHRFDGTTYIPVGVRGGVPELLDHFRSGHQPSATNALGRILRTKKPVHLADVREGPGYKSGDSAAKAVVEVGGARSYLLVPLLKDQEVIGAITIFRQEVRPFSEKQIQLLSSFGNQAVIAIENARLFEQVQSRTKELQESLEYQTATSQVLGVIARSPGELQPVLDRIVETASRLCGAEMALVHLQNERSHAFQPAASYGYSPEILEAFRNLELRPERGHCTGRALLEGRTVQMLDVLTDPEYAIVEVQQTSRHRTTMAVPLNRDGKAIGVISLSRRTVRAFNEKQIALVETFADQAVIAIENTRLFEAEQARTRELQESLEYQTATSEVLGVISRSPNKVQPVLDTIVQTARRLCESDRAQCFMLENGKYCLAAYIGTDPEFLRYLSENPISAEPGSGSTTGKAARERRTIHVPDIFADAEYASSDLNRTGRGRSVLGVPLLRGDVAIGVITVARDTVRPFTDRQIELVETFADQAGIAIENTRLFEEVQARTRDLQASLEYQTATAEVLSVISRSPSQVQPVLDIIAETAGRLCQAENAAIWRFTGDAFQLAAHTTNSAAFAKYLAENPLPTGSGSLAGRVVLDRRTIHLPDVLADPVLSTRPQFLRSKTRSALGVPLLRDGVPKGVIILTRQTVLPFTEKQIELVTTFADQAVIALDNARLFQEVQARNRDLTALGEVGRAVSSTLDLKVVLKTIVDRAVELSATHAGSLFYYRKENGTFELGETTGLDGEMVARLRKLEISASESGLSEAINKRQPLQIPDLIQLPSDPLRDAVVEAGFRASLIVPLLSSESPLGTLILRRRQAGEFPEAVVSLMQSFADQSAIALENARLFEEIAQKGRELEIASQHKSQFVANMSHELRTPLAAILGYAELIQEGFYEPQGPKSLDALTRIRSNGKHLLGLINTVLDIAKIESGQFSLNLGEYTMENVVETVRAATEALAETKKLGLKTEVAKSLPIGMGDEQRLTQVLLNLVGNAIKFTDKGEVRISAIAVNSQFAVSVSDTGPGIPLEEQKRIFEQFHQIDSSNTKAKGGTGLGLAIAKQIVEMHGGRIWVESIVGKSSTFHLELPVRVEKRKAMA